MDALTDNPQEWGHKQIDPGPENGQVLDAPKVTQGNISLTDPGSTGQGVQDYSTPDPSTSTQVLYDMSYTQDMNTQSLNTQSLNKARKKARNPNGSRARTRVKHNIFVEHYLETFDAQQAALRAGYKKYSASHASQLLNNPRIILRIQERLNELKVSSDETLIRLTRIARGTMAYFYNQKKKTASETTRGAKNEIQFYRQWRLSRIRFNCERGTGKKIPSYEWVLTYSFTICPNSFFVSARMEK